MADFRGGLPAEPLVGEVVALRTFRLDATGTLLPLYSHEAWYDGVNVAACERPAVHPRDSGGHPLSVPAEGCECGFYAYGTPEAAGRNRNMRHVQAIVSCWGNVVAGTQGIRSERARIDALWLSANAPDWMRRRVAVRYPSARVYADLELMRAEHPLSMLPCYEPPTRRHTAPMVVGALGTVVVGLGLVPYHVLAASRPLWLGWLAAVAAAVLLTLWCAVRVRGPGHGTIAMLLIAMIGWLIAPAFGLIGWLLRLPVLHGAAVACGSYLLSLRPRHFPIQSFERERQFYGQRA